MKQPIIDVIIPAYNEEGAIGKVVGEIPKFLVRDIVVVNNNSRDRTPQVAQAAGATVLHQLVAGYGIACLKGMEYLEAKSQKPDIVVFLDGDYSDYPEQMPDLVAPITRGEMDLVIGSGALGELEKGAMTPQQIFGNWLATNLIKLFYGYQFTDLGPFRAVRYDSLMAMGMDDKNYGWTVEMQVRAAKMQLRCTEIAVNYRKRIGKSKVSGTVKGTILAGQKILWTIFRLL